MRRHPFAHERHPDFLDPVARGAATVFGLLADKHVFGIIRCLLSGPKVADDLHDLLHTGHGCTRHRLQQLVHLGLVTVDKVAGFEVCRYRLTDAVQVDGSDLVVSYGGLMVRVLGVAPL